MKRCKKLLHLLLALCLVLTLLPVPAHADTGISGTCGANLTWNLDSSGTLTISGTGAMDDYGPGGAPWYSRRGQIKTVNIGPGVTHIGAGAFADGGEAVLNVGTSFLGSKFSPFFAETAYDQELTSLTQAYLLGSDRTGQLLLNARNGQTVPYGATDYTYTGIADCDITRQQNGTVTYDFTLRDDVTFSDGKPLTADDVIFTLYVLCDPTYDGNITLWAQPIQGLADYRSGMKTRGEAIFEAGSNGYTANSQYTKAQYDAFWNYYNNRAGADFAQEICNYCISKGYNAPEDSVAACAANWGYQLPADATTWDFWLAMVEANGSVESAESVESAGSTLLELTIRALGDDYRTGVQTGYSAPSITGIRKTGDYSVRITMTKADPTAIYQLGFAVAPLHYYGETAKYNYAANQFGFTKGDLRHIRSVTAQPMGAGPYRFTGYSAGVATLEANDAYFRGAPKTRYVNFVESQDHMSGIIGGSLDIGSPAFSSGVIDQIRQANGGPLSGPVITTACTDNLGYGYIGMNAVNVRVGDDIGSRASRNLRKAFATVFAAYRDLSVSRYYGDRANVIEYPISDTSWAAPRPGDPGYRRAYSVDADGNEIYTAGMTDQQRYDAALQAALTFFRAAGYTVSGGKVTAAPAGAKLEYTLWIPGDGWGDHPSYLLATKAAAALKTIGITLNIKDLTNSSELWDNLDAIQVDMWAAAWGSTVDPDMYQIYYSDAAHGPTDQRLRNPYGGPAQGGSNYEYCIADPELDRLILDARSSLDFAYRKGLYRQCLDIVLDWGVEVPVYQRQNAVLFSTTRVNVDTLPGDMTTFYDWTQEIEKLEMNEAAAAPHPITVNFKGNAPSIAADAFAGAVATVTYPAGNKTWTDSVRQQYGGTLTWSACGWLKDATGWWYLNPDGSYPRNGWQMIDGKWYHFDASGYMQTGWLSDGGKWYYLTDSGDMVTGWRQISGKWYWFTDGGDMVTGWRQIGGKWYWFTGSGDMVTGWKQIGSAWYYFNAGGDMVTGWKQIGSKWYYFNAGGDMVTGWKYVGGKWYWFTGSGDMVTGWKYIGGSWYYFESSGAMLANTSRNIGGKVYHFNASGACTNP